MSSENFNRFEIKFGLISSFVYLPRLDCVHFQLEYRLR